MVKNSGAFACNTPTAWVFRMDWEVSEALCSRGALSSNSDRWVNEMVFDEGLFERLYVIAH